MNLEKYFGALIKISMQLFHNFVWKENWILYILEHRGKHCR